MILNLATAAEVAELHTLLAQRDSAREKLKEVQDALQRVETDIWSARARSGRDTAAMTAAYLGEGARPTRSAGPSVADLQAAKDGINVRLEDAKAAVSAAAGALQGRAVELIRTCAERLAPAYAAAAGQVAALHAQLGAAQALLARVAPRATSLLDVATWEGLNIPGSQQIDALRDRGNVVAPAFGIRALAGGDPVFARRAVGGARDALEAAVYATCGGAWPFIKGADVDASPVPVATPEQRNSRRAVLEGAVR